MTKRFEVNLLPQKNLSSFLIFIFVFSRKLKSRWSGLFTVVQAYSHGAVDLQWKDGATFKVNDQRLKIYLGGDVCRINTSIDLK